MHNGGNKLEVYILLTDTGTLFTKMIKMFTRDQLNHASISFSQTLDKTYSFGRKKPANPFIGGFVEENLNCKLFNRATCAVYKCQISSDDYEKMIEFVQQIEEEQQQYKYNFLGLFSVLLKKEWNRGNAYFCSEFVATTLKQGGISIKSKPANLVKPKDIIYSGQFQCIYEGQLRNYPSLNNIKTFVTKTKRESKFFHIDTLCIKLAKSIVS
ncbi:hypothetical protein [Lederbergia graminis]|uniref:Uncharacterized protein n=1 Tax=Lederbergia graminis TaxID=735518 RepID=A0ABW0LJL3_9BACI